MAATAETETWELNIDGRVSMAVSGARGQEKNLTAKGKGQRIRLTTEDRELAEEVIRDSQNNPFINGMLSQISGPVRERREGDFEEKQQMDDEELAGCFALDDADFIATLDAFSEPNVRRLRTLFKDRGGKVSQQEILNEYIETKWPASSGDTPTYREMDGAPVG